MVGGVDASLVAVDDGSFCIHNTYRGVEGINRGLSRGGWFWHGVRTKEVVVVELTVGLNGADDPRKLMNIFSCG